MRKRTYKKAASFVLALAMAVSVCTAALADSTEPPTPETTVSEQNGAPEQGNTAAGENTQPEETADEGESENDIAGQDTTQGSNSVTVTDGATLTLKQFNSLTEIPADVTKLTVELGNIDITQRTVLGNENIADEYYVKKSSDTIENNETVIVDRTNENGNDYGYIVCKKKPAITITFVNGTVQGDSSVTSFPANCNLTVQVPDNADIIFDGVTFNGGVRSGFGWNQTKNFGGGVFAHRYNSITIKNSTFNGAWLHNGEIAAQKVTFDNCKFNSAANESSISPIWIQNFGQNTTGRELTIQNCIFEASGPIKVTEHETCGMVLKVLNNTFNMHNKNKANEFRNDAIYFSGGGSTLGDVLIQGNKLTGDANALIATPQHRDENGKGSIPKFV